MSSRRLVTTVGVVSVAAILIAGFTIPQARANHCHPEHSAAPTVPAKSVTRLVSARIPEPTQQRTRARATGARTEPVGPGRSNVQHRPGQTKALSLEKIYCRDFPMAIVSLGEAIKAMQSGDRQTELAELSKAAERLLEVYEALGSHIRPQFANSLSCPMMGLPINASTVDDSLTRGYMGRKVAFCCAGCPSAWDQLSEAQKRAKLPGMGM